MQWLKSHLLVLVILVSATPLYAESSTCLMVYKEGGAPAVFRSPKCPLWKLSNYASQSRATTARCQSAMLQGRRKSQEDRTFCALDVRIPFPAGAAGHKEVAVTIVAVFDGHNGADASEMASQLLLEYFVLHSYFLLDATYSIISKKSTGRLPCKGEQHGVFQVFNRDERLSQKELDFGRFKFSLPPNDDDSFHLEILKEALMRAIHDIDTKFSKEAYRNNLDSGSTATVILIADGQILVANVGDSKALLCSEKFHSPEEAKAIFRLYRQKRRSGAISPVKYHGDFNLAMSNGLTHFTVKELTRDHHPDRDDERFRVENAGGYVLERGGVPRINGQLAVSRAIGDVPFKSYGVISAPEVTDWQPLTANDSYLVVASDGVFDKLSLEDVCDILWEVHNHGTLRSELSSACSYSLADCIVKTAFEKGSMDNVAAIVLPLQSMGVSQHVWKERCVGVGDVDSSVLGLQKFIYEQSANEITSNLVKLEHAHPVVAKFGRLLVEGKHGSLGCFYLSENLDENVELTMLAQKHDKEDETYDLHHALPKALGRHFGGSLNLYNDQNFCFNLGMGSGGSDQCINPEGFASFLGLLESVPFQDAGPNYGSFEYAKPDLRYELKKRFGRGSYGEVWLAIHWNCHQGSDATNRTRRDRSVSFNTLHFDMYSRHSKSQPSTRNCTASCDDDLFILKRIMVERGPAVYLSGLREKYFGEVFLNASANLGDFPSANAFMEGSQTDFDDLFERNKTVDHEVGKAWSSDNIFSNYYGLHRVVYEEGLNHIVRYVESFESRSNEIWLVFRHEGVSLSKLMYSVEEVEDHAEEGKYAQVLRPSKWWHWLKTTEAGQEEMHNLIWQLVMAVKSCHDRNITHRDIKPENMVICFEEWDTGRCLKGSPSGDKNFTMKMRIIDFGSAIDEFTMKHLYGSHGPSRAEQTYDYSPPEASLNASWFQGPTKTTLKYDMWSIGVVILELFLGSPNVFQISALTRTLLDQHLEGWNESLKELAYKLRAFMEMCILIPGSSSKHNRVGGTKDQGGVSPASWKCSEEFFSHQIKSRDPLKIGFPNVWAMRLVRQLLLWDPEDRLSIDDALQHPYFQPPP